MIDRLAILTYHSVDDTGSVLSTHPETFARQMACLAELGYRGAPLGEVVKQSQRSGQWPERTIAITFDDGYENNLRVALPILARHGFSASVYLITGHVGGTHEWEPPPPGLGSRPILDWAQVGELADAGWEIGAHTYSHPDLRKLRPEAVAQEILSSRDDIVKHLGRAVETFAYPGGHVSDAATAVVAREFVAGCTTVLRRADGDDPLHALPRVDAYYLRDLQRFRRLATGQLDRYLTVRRLGRRIRAMLR
jgi:peptidoglycan/xylan/chitin deacetylase (PgdA/CDA1 family)